jgi:hypothetical protein
MAIDLVSNSKTAFFLDLSVFGKSRSRVDVSRMARSIRFLTAGAALAASCTSVSVSAEDQPFNIRVGGILAQVDTKVKVDSTSNPGNGDEVDFETDLSLKERNTIGFAEIAYRAAPRLTLNFQYLRLSRSSSTVIDRQIAVGDTVYPVNADIAAQFSSNLYRARVDYSIIENDQAEAGISLGAHVTDFNLAIEGIGSVGNAIGVTREERRKVTAPLPNVGIFGRIEVANRVKLSAQASYLDLKIDSIKGGLTDLEANISYQATNAFAIGAGYRSLGYRLDGNGERLIGTVRFKYQGPVLFVSARF